MSDINWRQVIIGHWGKILGGVIGLIFALMVVNYGFLISLFIFLCIAIGIVAGWRLELSKDLGRVVTRYLSPRN